MNALLLPLADVTFSGVVGTLVVSALVGAAVLGLMGYGGNPDEQYAAQMTPQSEPPAPMPAEPVQMYYLLDAAGVASGPFTPLQVAGMRKAGKLGDDMYMARGGDEDWLPLSAWEDVLNAKPAVPVPAAGAVLLPEPKRTAGQGLQLAGGIFMGLGVLAAVMGMALMGPMGLVFGGSSFGLGFVLSIIGLCIG